MSRNSALAGCESEHFDQVVTMHKHCGRSAHGQHTEPSLTSSQPQHHTLLIMLWASSTCVHDAHGPPFQRPRL
jgi:hypothetical protein